MHQVIFYPVGNGDTSQIILNNGKRILFDFRHLKKSEEEGDPHINLNDHLKDELKKADKDYFDVVAFTHGDKDHIENSTEFFELQHAKKYQGDGRIKIKTLWVPAAMILETAASDSQSSEFVIWRQEARYRLKEGKDIRVFSKPAELKKWFEDEKLDFDSRKHLITDAGKLAEDFSLEDDGVEFFCHSPFIKHVDEGDDMRNSAALIFNVRFRINGSVFDYLAVGDSEYEVLEDIISITKYHSREDRLHWDLFNIPHHCSYKALNKEKGDNETEPAESIKELLGFGRLNSYLVSSSKPIENNKEAYDQEQPPHVQAKNCYKKYLKKVNGADLLVTMEEPKRTKPEPLIFKIESRGISLDSKTVAAAAAITSSPAKRAGHE
ncbi:hypothetical protein SAMN05660337_3230 [Maridesulfovibrio ferrireducens]|uniref:Beta-lactamase superfamily domain-containing protein n=1 Tax=Maridesulfovibrio ferrireducens TaxID=246191 RepID=A0A1G9KVG9_9BACT|nr:hypothetical protein [Maridesulfovibrio ferrireducens]SDL53702.1 hypothetical protein SAMN05660337_3230 [Maridesulfovibrio ferrireducens]